VQKSSPKFAEYQVPFEELLARGKFARFKEKYSAWKKRLDYNFNNLPLDDMRNTPLHIAANHSAVNLIEKLHSELTGLYRENPAMAAMLFELVNIDGLCLMDIAKSDSNVKEKVVQLTALKTL